MLFVCILNVCSNCVHFDLDNFGRINISIYDYKHKPTNLYGKFSIYQHLGTEGSYYHFGRYMYVLNCFKIFVWYLYNVKLASVNLSETVIHPLSPHDALKHHFTSLTTDLIFLKQGF